MSHSFQNALYTWLKLSSACRDGVLNLSRSDSARFVIKYIVWRSLDCLWLLLKSGKVVSYWGCQPDQHQISTYQSKTVWTSLEVHADLDWSFSRDNSRLLCHMQEFLDDSSSSTVVCIVYLLFWQWSWVRIHETKGTRGRSSFRVLTEHVNWPAPLTLSDHLIFYFLFLIFLFFHIL